MTRKQGSSGSPLFNAQGYIVGSLCCGTSSCSYIDQNNIGPNGYDYYGKLAYSWTSNNNSLNSKKLQPWLDPDNWGNVALAGRYWNNTDSVQNTEFNTFKIVPNPSNGMVVFNDLNLENNALCQIFDAYGKMVFNTNLAPDYAPSINVSNLNNGIYFVEIYSNNKVFRSKMMIAK